MKACVVTNDAKASLPLHRHEDARIIVVLEGEVRESDLSGARIYRPGDVLFRPPFCAHANRPAGAPSAFQRFSISRKAWMGFVRRHGWRGMRGEIDLNAREQRQMLHAHGGGEDLFRLLAERCASSAFFELPDEPPVVSPAHTRGLKPYQATRRFQKEFGIAPTALRNERQLRRALSHLAATSASLAEIAQDCGFSDQSHMTRRLKRATGMTPAAFRRFARD